MTDSKINKIISFIKDGDFVSVNDDYNKDVLGFSSQEHKQVLDIISSLYGMRYNWPSKINVSLIKKEIKRDRN